MEPLRRKKSGTARNGTNRRAEEGSEPATENVGETYDALADIYSEKYETGNPDELFLDAFLSHLKKRARLLDLGCGTGSGARYFYESGVHVEGIDVSSRMIEEARRRNPAIPFNRADIRNLIPHASAFDAIWAGYSLFHMGRRDFQVTIGKIQVALRRGGIFGLTMQEGTGELQVPEPLVPGKSLLVCLYSREELRELLNSNGFEVIDFRCRKPASALEYPFLKLLFISRATQTMEAERK